MREGVGPGVGAYDPKIPFSKSFCAFMTNSSKGNVMSPQKTPGPGHYDNLDRHSIGSSQNGRNSQSNQVGYTFSKAVTPPLSVLGQ